MNIHGGRVHGSRAPPHACACGARGPDGRPVDAGVDGSREVVIINAVLSALPNAELRGSVSTGGLEHVDLEQPGAW